MIDANEHNQQFNTLLNLLLDGDISSDQVQELIALANQSPELKQVLQEQLAFDNLLTQVEDPKAHGDVFLNEVMLGVELEEQNKDLINHVFQQSDSDTLKEQRNAKWSIYLSWLLTALSTGISLILLFIFAATYEDSSADIVLDPIKNIEQEVRDSGVAIIVNSIDQSIDALAIGKSLKPGKLTLEKGYIELEFYRGARVIIAGPAKLELTNAERIKLKQGRILVELPNVALGFVIDTPNTELVDVAQLIGVDINSDTHVTADANANTSLAEHVFVFEGNVEARAKQGGFEIISTGEALNVAHPELASWVPVAFQKAHFRDMLHIDNLAGNALEKRKNKWLALKAKILNDASLVVYYDFNKSEGISGRRILKNIAPTGDVYDGAIVGARWEKGPWQGKSQLNFKRVGDRVRVNIDHPMKSFTFASWVRIDSLDRYYSSLLLTDGYSLGDMHWQIANPNMFKKKNKKVDEGVKNGRSLIGLLTDKGKGRNYVAKPFYSLKDSGRWFHLAVTVDSSNNQVSHYVDGEKISEDKMKFKSDFWNIGEASIGNWTSRRQDSTPVRNLNGAMAEMMIFERALLPDEIREIALK